MSVNDRPTVIIARTKKGKGVAILEDLGDWHGKVLKPEQEKKAIVDEDYEEKVRSVFRSSTSNVTYERETYNYQQEPALKEAFVREEIRVKKVVEQDTVEAQDTIRREELDVHTAGKLRVDENVGLHIKLFK